MKYFIILFSISMFILIVAFFVGLTSKDRSVLFLGLKDFKHGSDIRKYRESVPSGEVEKIIFGFHGFGDNSLRFAYYTALHNLVDENTLVIYPEAIPPKTKDVKTGWNAAFCCGSGWYSKSDDVEFIKELLKSKVEEYGLENAKVFAAGFSNGALFTHRLGVEVPELFSAIAMHSGSIGTKSNNLMPTSKLPVLILHGEEDMRIPIEGGTDGKDLDFDWISHNETIKAWSSVSDKDVSSILYAEDKHIWHDWRLFNFWNKYPEGSKDIIHFFNKY